jgi:hypothetical protein
MYRIAVSITPNGDWAGVSCESDAWPYSPELVVFETRRAIGQMARSWRVVADPQADPALLYIQMAHAIETTLKEVLNDLVAEARSRGVTWAEIGRTLGVKDTAAQKGFAGVSRITTS